MATDSDEDLIQCLPLLPFLTLKSTCGGRSKEVTEQKYVFSLALELESCYCGN